MIIEFTFRRQLFKNQFWLNCDKLTNGNCSFSSLTEFVIKPFSFRDILPHFQNGLEWLLYEQKQILPNRYLPSCSISFISLGNLPLNVNKFLFSTSLCQQAVLINVHNISWKLKKQFPSSLYMYRLILSSCSIALNS